MSRFHMNMLWNGNFACEGIFTGSMVLDTVSAMKDSFVHRNTLYHAEAEIGMLRDFLWHSKEKEHVVLFGDETGSVTAKIIRR